MEKLPPISEMYASIQQQRDYDVIRRYETARTQKHMTRNPTKKGSFLDDAIKMSNSPGPANKSNLQDTWAKVKKQANHSERKTYIDEIQANNRKKNQPSPNHYNIKMDWPEKGTKDGHVSEKINFLDHSEYEANQTPGPGNYLIATHIAKKVKEYHHTETKPLQPRQNLMADMNTYNPIPVAYATFKRYQKVDKNKSIIVKKQQPKKQIENLSPGPGQYQMINAWKGKQEKIPKGSLSYLSKITKGPSPTVYYH